MREACVKVEYKSDLNEHQRLVQIDNLSTTPILPCQLVTLVNIKADSAAFTFTHQVQGSSFDP